ncbi:hypothetical protein [Halobaculum magnesiiphilum]|uniref:Uncharacterized protein n=1 Tax=Halobaculum magnesiiphilum TaxID=1017351 RepID=A0A8T8WD35_9EURY|nr:hypothetical protein [Halobaculum magnesiiphilum]QZP37750.1 hypothetical protein K6T50_00790 [Halobaculum magnesiiphilum]
MPDVVPAPSEFDKPVNEPLTVELDGGERATFTYAPRQQTTPGFVVPIVAASKYTESSYTVWFDGRQVYGPAPIPPTDIDDLAITFLPAYEFEEQLKVRCENLSENTPRRYTVQPVGYEKVNQGGSE